MQERAERMGLSPPGGGRDFCAHLLPTQQPRN
jgi:hypothetical protein